MNQRLPARAEDFTVAWLNEHLVVPEAGQTARIIECRSRASTTPGQTAEIAFLDVEWDQNGPDLPTRLIAKYTSQNPQVIAEIVNVFDQYRRETGFYRDFEAPGIDVAACFFQCHQPDQQAFVLILEDLGPSESPSWAISESQVTFALAQLPKLHARWWNQALLREKDYFVQYDDPAFFALGFGAAAQIVEQLGTWFDAPDFTQELMPMVAKKLSALQALYANRPFTLVHGDYHAKQLFFPSAAGGRFAVIDWQFPFIAQGAWDFARLLTLGLATVDRRARETSLLDQYHQGLVDGGVEDYTLDDLTLDFQLGLIISHMINIIAIGSTDEQLIKEECDALGVDWKDVMFYRGQNALKDWQVLELISEL